MPKKKEVTVTETKENHQVELPGLPAAPKKRGRPSTGKALSPAERKRRSRYEAARIAIESPQDASITGLIETLASLHRDYGDGKSWAGHHGVKICRELLRRFEAMNIEAEGDTQNT